jgi:O-acetyl-ADP-ribose deacetylase (regulator of RNase III)
MFELNEANYDYLKCNTHSEELKNININKYIGLISKDNQLDTYTKNKNKIKLLYSDLNDYNDECLVNAANELLLGGGGIDGFVHELGGQQLLDEVNKIPFNGFGCRLCEGEAIFTNGYNDKYKKFIHTVAPYYDDNNMLKHNVLEQCFDSIFTQVRNNNIESITIPPIGTGFYGFHMYDFTIICLRKIIYHLDLNPNIRQITLITNSKLQYNYYNTILNDYIHQL